MFKRLLGGFMSAAMLMSAAMPVFAAGTPHPGAPQNLSVPAAATTYSSISVIWDKPEDYKDISGYNIYIDGTFTAAAAANETYYTAENLTSDTEYTITVKAVKGTEESAASNAVTAKTDVKGEVHDVTAAPYNAAGDGKADDTAANSLTLGSGTYKYVFDGKITPPETLELEEPVQYDSETFDFSTLTNDEFPSTYKGDKVFNEYVTLHFNDDYSSIV